jgi:hypothetical protein
VESFIAPVAAAVDRLDQVPGRLRFLFDYSAERTLADARIREEAAAARPVIEALADDLKNAEPLLNRDAFRAMVSRVKERTGQKGRSLLHPIRVVLTGEPEGLELDVAVPAIERGARVKAGGLRPISGATQRAAAFRTLLPA